MASRAHLLLLGLGSCILTALHLFRPAPLQATVLRSGAAQSDLAAATGDAEHRHACFSRASDYDGPLQGDWRDVGGGSGLHYAEVMGDRAALRRGDVNTEAAERWAARACVLEDAMHSCYYHGEPHASTISARDFTSSHCRLERFDAARLLQSLPDTDVYFFGDSIMRQLWQSVGCHASRYIVTAEVFWVKAPFQGKGNCPFKNATHCYSFGPDCVVFGHNGSSTKMCYMMSHPDIPLDDWMGNARHFRLSPTSSEVVLFNGGLHFPKTEPSMYRDFLQKVADGANAVRSGGGRFIWMETTPQHFPTEDGSYNKTARGGRCRPIEKLRPSWTNEIAVPYMRQLGFDVLYTFDNAWSQWDSHVGATYRNDQLYESGDCSHFCLPGVPDLWSRILYNMVTAAPQ